MDLRSRHLTATERSTLVHALEAAGFAVYDLSQTAAPHLHCILSKSSCLDEAARAQRDRLYKEKAARIIATNHER